MTLEPGALFDLDGWRQECPDDSFREMLAELKDELRPKMPHLPADELQRSKAYYQSWKAQLLATYPELNSFSQPEPTAYEEQAFALCGMILPLIELEVLTREGVGASCEGTHMKVAPRAAAIRRPDTSRTGAHADAGGAPTTVVHPSRSVQMEAAPMESTVNDLSGDDLEHEQAKLEDKLKKLLDVFPNLAGPDPGSLTAQYIVSGSPLAEQVELESRIKSIKLERLRRGLLREVTKSSQQSGSVETSTPGSDPEIASQPSADGETPASAVGARPIIGRTIEKRGPKAKMEFHHAVAEVVNSFGANWKEHLDEIAEKLDKQKQKTPSLKAWASGERKAQSWTRALEYYPERVVKALKYSLKMAAKDTAGETFANSR